MEQYINKNELVAKIEGLKSAAETMLTGKTDLSYWKAQKLVCEKLLSFLNTLETKEVDLEKEIKDYFNNQPMITRSKGVDYQLIPSAEEIARHFYELGLNEQKEK